MPKGKKSADPDFGRCLMKQHAARFSKRNPANFKDELTTESEEVQCLPSSSIIQESDLTAILQRTNLAIQNFESGERIKIISEDSLPNKNELNNFFDEHRHLLSIPRKPNWHPDMSKKELQHLEEEALYDWRRKLSVLESKENTCLTPYEKNLEFWRELWRVLERSDVLVQIVDARNPLLYYSPDLNTYFQEQTTGRGLQQRSCLLLLNKSDLLTPAQRLFWKSYFQDKGVQVAFWSAKLSLEEEVEGEEEEKDSRIEKEEETEKNTKPEDACPVLSRKELLTLMRSLCSEQGLERKIVGLTGYPNVGKSATLNALIQTKKSAVSATPGRTKHMQTFNIDENLTLCDSPGLVIPSFAYSQADLIAAGILSIEQMRDCVSPIKLICQQFPRQYLAQRYSLIMPDIKEGDDPHRSATAQEFLSSYAFLHGYLTDNGNPHLHRVARIILKQYAAGELLYRHPPPGVCDTDYMAADLSLPKAVGDAPKTWTEAADPTSGASAAKDPVLNEFDQKFFQNVCKPKHNNMKQPGFGILASAPTSGGKVRKSKQLKQKEKLRRRFAELDKHDYEL